MQSDTVLQVEGLCKTYPQRLAPFRQVARLLAGRQNQTGGFQALKPISFSVQRGETLGIIGRNGAGKSTLLQLICGTLTPTAGSVRMHGRLAALLELGAGFNPEFTGRENIFLSAAVYGLTQAEIHQRLEQIIGFAQIGEHIDQPVKTYSSGMFVRLAFAVIAHVDADILVIDEALAVGDVYFTQKCMRFLRDFSRRGTLLFVSHDTHSVVSLCKKAIWIEQGELKYMGDAKTAAETYLASFYDSVEPAAPSEPVTSPASADLTTGTASEPPTPRADNNFADDFGLRGGELLGSQLLDEQGQPLTQLTQAQTVELLVDCQAHIAIEQPIVGFYIKDRLGQPICGTNTLSTLPDWQHIAKGERTRIKFRFHLPLLATGNYTLTVALAAGTQLEHVQHHWVHDMLSFKAVADPHLSGIFTLPRVDSECLTLPA